MEEIIIDNKKRNYTREIKSPKFPYFKRNYTREIETPKYPYFKGLDGKEYPDSQTMQTANQEWMKQNNRYISPWTGKEYTDYDVMQRDESEYWRQQIKPEEKIFNK